MHFSGLVLKVISFWVLILGVLGGVFQILAGAAYISNGVDVLLGSLIVAPILYGIGGVFLALVDITASTKRTADALDLLVQRRTGVGTLPPNAAKRLREQPPPTPRQSS